MSPNVSVLGEAKFPGLSSPESNDSGKIHLTLQLSVQARDFGAIWVQTLEAFKEMEKEIQYTLLFREER